MSDDEPTCGKGLAHHSVLPEKLAAWAEAMSEMLALHQKSLDANDPAAKPELDAYVKLTDDYRNIAASLRATAERMASYRDLPMPAHDEAVLMSKEAEEIFATLMRAERAAADRFREFVEEHEQM